MRTTKEIEALIRASEKGVHVDLGGGALPMRGFLNIDYRDLPEVDIVHNLTVFPWPLPDECASLVMASHLVEHINPTGFDPRFGLLVELLVRKKLLTPGEVAEHVGETDSPPVFMRFMDEVWRILKPEGEFMMVFPYAGSHGYWQDPTHVNPINESTFAYFDPFEPRTQGVLYNIYKPRPWKIKEGCFSWNANGNMEVVLIKRRLNPPHA